MRQILDKFLCKYNNPDLYFLHADMWHFTSFKNKYPERCLNFGIGETNMVNVAGGLASQGKKVIIYGVAGFVYQRAYEQLKFSVVNFGKNITLVNAGSNGCYSKCGIGHIPNDDYNLMQALNIKCYEPSTGSEFLKALTKCIKNNETNFIRLGWDNCKW